MKDLRVIFMGTPDFSVPVLKALVENTNVILVVTQPDKAVGRKQELKPSPVKEFANSVGIPVFQPEKISKDNERILNAKADLIVTCAYGQIIPEVILDNPEMGCINVHASLLPKLRGGAPIHHAIIDGYDKTGITIMYMDKNMDTGDIISQRECPIEDTDNVETLHDKLSKIGADLLIETLTNMLVGSITRTKQNDEEATYAWNIKREEEHINFNRTAREVYNQIRGLYPFPKAYCLINNEETKILEAYIGEKDSDFSSSTICDITKDAIGIATKDKLIYITKIKPFGKKEMLVKDYLNGVDKNKLLHDIIE